MSTDDKPAALDEEEARAAINRWNDGRAFRIKYLGDKIFINEIVPQSSYTLRLRTQYEERSVSQESVPFPGGTVDDRGVPPGPWDIEVRRPSDFEERTETIPVPHTERVTMCTRCAGQGRVECSACHGSGKVNCTWCNGTGYRERQEHRSEPDAHGNPSTRLVTVRENCTCSHGKVTCTTCSGNGRRTCPGCSGAGCVKTFEQLTVKFGVATDNEVLDTTGVPDHLVGRLTGDVVADERAPRIGRVPAATAEVDRRTAALLEKAQAVDERQKRVLFQHLHVERVNIHEVRYSYAGVSRQLWICGKEQHVHAPGAPRLWKQLAMIITGGVAALIAVIVLLVLVLR